MLLGVGRAPSNAPATPSRSTSPVISGATSISPSAIDRSDAGELHRVVAEHELDVQLLADPEERVDRVGLHAHADDHDPRCAGARAQDVVDDAGHADGLEDHERRAAPARAQASNAGSSRGSTTSWAPIAAASARRAGEKSAATIGSMPFELAARRSRPGRPARSPARGRRRPA